MKTESALKYENPFFEPIMKEFSKEIHELFVKTEGNNDHSQNVEIICLWLSEIITFAASKPVPKTLGSVSNNGTGDRSLRQLKILTPIKKNSLVSNDFEELSYFYSIFKKHEITPLINNFYKDDILLEEIDILNEKLDKLKKSILNYNEQINRVKTTITKLKHEKSFVFLAYNISCFLPLNADSISPTQPTVKYIDLIKRCFAYIEDLAQHDHSLKIDENRRKFIFKTLPEEFFSCDYKNFCSIGCKCPQINGFSKCEKPPTCIKCGATQSVIEKYHHYDSLCAGYEFSDSNDFCLLFIGIKAKKPKKSIQKKTVQRSKAKEKNINHVLSKGRRQKNLKTKNE